MGRNSKNSTFHFTYISRHVNGRYYIGRHSTNKVDDNYLGSGRWIRSVKNKSDITREILSFHNTFEELKIAEEKLLAEHIQQDLCMNYTDASVGFGYGDLNHTRKEENRKTFGERSKQMWKDGVFNNRPKHSDETKAKLREARARQIITPEQYRIGAEKRRGVPRSEETKKKLSESRKGKYTWIKNPDTRQYAQIRKELAEQYYLLGWIPGKFQQNATCVKL